VEQNSAQNSAQKSTQGGPKSTGLNAQIDKSHILSLPLQDTHVDRAPHTYERWLVAKLMRMAGSPPIRFRLWNGDVIEPVGKPARFTLHLADPKALYALVTNPNLAFGDLYSAGRLDIEGDLPDRPDGSALPNDSSGPPKMAAMARSSVAQPYAPINWPI